jgi:hypothetical protein
MPNLLIPFYHLIFAYLNHFISAQFILVHSILCTIPIFSSLFLPYSVGSILTVSIETFNPFYTFSDSLASSRTHRDLRNPSEMVLSDQSNYPSTDDPQNKYPTSEKRNSFQRSDSPTIFYSPSSPRRSGI